MKMDIGIMGGTFDPIHNGHILLAEKALKTFQLSKILVMPSANPPHKQNLSIENVRHRCDMVRLAIEDYPSLIFSDFEIKREGYTYTADTLNSLKEKYNKMYFIIGADSFFNIENWHQPEVIMKLSTLVIGNRYGYSEKDLLGYKQHLKELYGADVQLLDQFDCPFSSTQIRDNIRKGLPVDEMISKKVKEYIEQNNLYQ